MVMYRPHLGLPQFVVQDNRLFLEFHGQVPRGFAESPFVTQSKFYFACTYHEPAVYVEVSSLHEWVQACRAHAATHSPPQPPPPTLQDLTDIDFDDLVPAPVTKRKRVDAPLFATDESDFLRFISAEQLQAPPLCSVCKINMRKFGTRRSIQGRLIETRCLKCSPSKIISILGICFDCNVLVVKGSIDSKTGKFKCLTHAHKGDDRIPVNVVSYEPSWPDVVDAYNRQQTKS